MTEALYINPRERSNPNADLILLGELASEGAIYPGGDDEGRHHRHHDQRQLPGRVEEQAQRQDHLWRVTGLKVG